MNVHNHKLGILGGGQLARMMVPTLKRWDLPFRILDQKNSVSRPFCHDYIEGDFKSHEDVVKAMKDCHVVTYDLEAISLSGIQELEKLGVRLAPSASVMEIIQDKGKQKDFFKEQGIPTSAYKLVEEDFESLGEGFIKARTDGYDGKGVFHWRPGATYPEAFKRPIVWEEKVDIVLEFSILVARNSKGDFVVYEPVDMVFNHDLNLIDYTLFPSRLDEEQIDKAQAMACRLVNMLDYSGIMAVEMFLTESGDIFVNELAPRPHNSGHHTIESHEVSQFENHLRGVLDLPLGEAKPVAPSSLTFNILGEGDGEAQVEGLQEILRFPHVYVHLYGKKEVRSGRKMGHVTITGQSSAHVLQTYKDVKNLLKVRSKT